MINGSLLLSNNHDDYDNFINHHKKDTALKQLKSSKIEPVIETHIKNEFVDHTLEVINNESHP